MNEFLLIFGMMIVTFGVRYPVLALVGKIDLPGPVFRALRYVPLAVLTAISVPAMLMPDGETILLGWNNAHLIAGIIAILIAWRSKNLLFTILGGMVVFLALRFLVGG